MAYFSNGTEGMAYEERYCFKCIHGPQSEDDPGCPVWGAHLLFSYQLCNAGDDPGKVILDMLIPDRDGYPDKCAMFKRRDGLTEKHLRDWEKYKAIMAEASPSLKGQADG